jgi:hypothetical protein
VVVWVSWKAAPGQLDASAIEQLAAGSDRDQHRRVHMLGNTDRRGWLQVSSPHVLSSGQR